MTLSRTVIALAAGTLLIGVPPAHAQHRGGGQHSRGTTSGRSYAVPRGSVGTRGGVVVAGRSAPRIVGSRPVVIAPVRFYRPYYTFRPRISLGFGLWSGFPVAYPYYYGYYDPYYSRYGYPNPYLGYPYPAYRYSPSPYPAYPVPPAYPYPSSSYPGYPTSTYPAYPAAPGSVGVQPGQSQANTGGVSFAITPDTAEVFIDDSYVGTVGDFTPTTQPLGLTPGRHRIEIRAPGYRTMDFSADVIAGQVIPFQGDMER